MNATGLYVGGITVSSDDKMLQFNEKQLTNALGVITQKEPVEYDHTHDMTEQVYI